MRRKTFKSQHAHAAKPFALLVITLNFGFVFGEVGDPNHHHVYELFTAIVVNLIATILKFGERTQIGAIHLASSFVADLQLIAAACVWGYTVTILGAGLDAGSTASIVSLAAGALAANILSVVLLVIETVMFHR
jgi:hypothetical protein